MNNHEKIRASGLLKVAKLAGFTVRGFRGLAATRGSGTKIEAASVTRGDGDAQLNLYVGASTQMGYRITWEGANRDKPGPTQEMRLSIKLSDEGDLIVEPWADATPAPTPDEPVWQ